MQWVSEDGKKFVQLWLSAESDEWVKRAGTVGREGKLTELGTPSTVDDADVIGLHVPDGYTEVADYAETVVVQWPLKSVKGTKRDHALLERAEEWLDSWLDERGYGYVDGFDVGTRGGDDGGFVQNVFCQVGAGRGAAAASSIATCLRTARLDDTRAEIAWRSAPDAPFVVTHPRRSNKLSGVFSL